jgi:RHS repeat-associated protein
METRWIPSNTNPYGSTRSSSGTIPPEKKFTGQRLDSATGHYRARYYDPEIGRFMGDDMSVHPECQINS